MMVIALVNVAVLSVVFTVMLILRHELRRIRRVQAEIEAAAKALVDIISQRPPAVPSSRKAA